MSQHAHAPAPAEAPAVVGRPRHWLRLDALVVLVASLGVFHFTHQHWWLYPALLFVPDVFMIGYVRGTSLGAALYNAGHSYFLPALVLAWGWSGHHDLASAIGIIWFGHVGWDRFFGYGLKYDSHFQHTHLGNLARTSRTAPAASRSVDQ